MGRELLTGTVAVSLRVALSAALEALNVGELLAVVLGVVGVGGLILAAVLAEEADLGIGRHVCCLLVVFCCLKNLSVGCCV